MYLCLIVFYLFYIDWRRFYLLYLYFFPVDAGSEMNLLMAIPVLS